MVAASVMILRLAPLFSGRFRLTTLCTCTLDYGRKSRIFANEYSFLLTFDARRFLTPTSTDAVFGLGRSYSRSTTIGGRLFCVLAGFESTAIKKNVVVGR